MPAENPLSHFVIAGPLGSGGMGHVFRARDTRLRREVALKFVSGDAIENAGARRRLLQEAESAATLNHPGICTIYEVNEVLERIELTPGTVATPGTPFIAMELIEGRTLSHILAEEKALRQDRALDIASQVARALATAHAAGIVHRDLKPQNVMITPDGRVKILDFGLAKPLPTGAKVTPDTVLTTLPLTEPGILLGTVPYMSPEQASGKPVDSRSDVFSFGVMLYEMLVGRRPFSGDTPAQILARIIEKDPEPLSTHRPDLPGDLERIVHRCLRKAPGDRYNDTRDLEAALNDLQRNSGSESALDSETVRLRRGRVRRLVIGGLATVVLLAIAVVIWELRPGVEQPNVVAPQVTPFLTGDALEGSASWSPLGNLIVYESTESGNWDIWICDVTGSNPLNLTGDSRKMDRSPVWSPDGNRIAFYSDRGDPGIYTMAATGGAVRRVTGVDWGYYDNDGDLALRWPELNHLLFTLRDSLGRMDVCSVPLGGGAPNVLTRAAPDGGRGGDLSPSGNLLAFCHPWGVDLAPMFILNRETGEIKTLPLKGDELRWASNGRTLFFTSSAEGSSDLWTVEVDPGTGAPTGEPVRLTTALNVAGFALSPDGEQVLVTRSKTRSNIWLIPTDPAPITTLSGGKRLTSGEFVDNWASRIPGSSAIVFSSNRRGDLDIWRLSPTTGKMVRLASDSRRETFPFVSPDGRWIVMGLYTGPKNGVPYMMRPDGNDLHPLDLTRWIGTNDLGVSGWAPDGQRLAFTMFKDARVLLGVATIDPETGEATDARLLGIEGSIPMWSPSGEFIAYQVRHDGISSIRVVDSDGTNPRTITEDAENQWLAAWSAAPDFIHYKKHQDGIGSNYRIPMNGSGEATGPPELWAQISAEIELGQFFQVEQDSVLTPVWEDESDIWLLKFQ